MVNSLDPVTVLKISIETIVIRDRQLSLTGNGNFT